MSEKHLSGSCRHATCCSQLETEAASGKQLRVGRPWSTGHRICQFRSPNLALSRDLLKTVQQEVYSSLSWSSQQSLQ